MKKLILATIAALMFFVGCATVSKTTVTLTSVVDSAMKDWAEASAQGKTTPAFDAKVIAAHDQYRAACGVALTAFEAAKANGDTASASAVLITLRASVTPLIDLISTAVTPAQSVDINTKLSKVNAP